jgi:hypothetical protein
VATVDIEYLQPLTNGWKVRYQAAADYRGSTASALLTSQNVVASPFTTVDGSIALEADRWTVRGFVRNLTNVVGVFGYSTAGVASGAAISRPRTIGVSLTYRYQ